MEEMAWGMIMAGCALFGMLALWMVSDHIDCRSLDQLMADGQESTSHDVELEKAA